MSVDPIEPRDADATPATGGHAHDHAHGHHGHAHDHEHEKTPPIEQAVEVEELPNWKRKLSVEVAPPEVEKRYEERLTELSTSAMINGFRQGRAPRQILVNRFGKEIKDEVKAKLVEDALDQASEEKELRVVGLTDLDLQSIPVDIGQPLKFEATVEIMPEFPVPDYKKLKVTRKSDEISEEEFEKALNGVLRENADLVPAPDDAEVQAEDVVSVDAKVVVDGETAYEVEEHPVSPMEDRLLGFPFPVEKDLLNGARRDQTLTADVTLPEGFREEAFAGKEGKLEVVVKEIKRRELPELTDELAKKFGMESAEDLRDRVREDLGTRRKEENRRDLRKQMEDALLERVDFELPEGMLGRATEQSMLQRQMQMVRMGLSPEMAKQMENEESRKEARQQTERQVKLDLILQKVAEAEEIEISDADLHGEIHNLAQRMGRPIGALHRELAQSGRLEQLRENLLEQKVLDLLEKEADITEE